MISQINDLQGCDITSCHPPYIEVLTIYTLMPSATLREIEVVQSHVIEFSTCNLLLAQVCWNLYSLVLQSFHYLSKIAGLGWLVRSQRFFQKTNDRKSNGKD